MSQDGIRLREFSGLKYYCPKLVLQKLRSLEIALLDSDLAIDPKVMEMRTNSLKREREARDAAIFAYGIQECVLRVPVWVARHESSDYDCVLQCISEETQHFFPVQLKELPPRELNPQVALKDILDKLDKYGKDLIVAIKYNRKEHFELGPELRLENAPVAQIWLFGGCSPDQSDWFLYGDLTKEPALYPFRYPDPPEGSEVDLGALFPP